MRSLKEYISGLEASAGGETVQGNDDWLKRRAMQMREGVRHFTIGGSELATVLGVNPHNNVDDFLIRKSHYLTTGTELPGDEESKILNTEWGHIMEPLLRLYCCLRFDTEILEVNASIPHPQHPNFRYSPDGVSFMQIFGSVIPMAADPTSCGGGSSKVAVKDDDTTYDQQALLEHVAAANNGEVATPLLRLVVWEFKCPMARRAGKDPVKEPIPVYYRPQVLAGPDTIQRAIGAIYVEANFCIQSWGDYGKAAYNTMIHDHLNLNGRSWKGKSNIGTFDGLTPLFSRVIKFEAVGVDPSFAALISMTSGPTASITIGSLQYPDVGQWSVNVFKLLLEQHKKGLVRAVIGDVEPGNIDQLRDFVGASQVILMPVTMFRSHVVYVPRRPNYIVGECGQKINEFISRLTQRVDHAGLHHSFAAGP